VDGERLVIFPTNFGGQQSPGWLYNLRANPQVTVTYQGVERFYRAREASGSEQEAYWKLGESFYPGYAAYRRRVRGRHIPVVVLEPAPAQE
jgi:deazaflavin-dependent oxidoreductase (nitroreductase family)